MAIDYNNYIPIKNYVPIIQSDHSESILLAQHYALYDRPVIARVSADDGNFMHENHLTYSIIDGNEDNLFDISTVKLFKLAGQKIGVIRLVDAKSFDYKTPQTYVLTVEVSDHFGARTTTTVTVVVAGEEAEPVIPISKPTFSQDIYTGTLNYFDTGNYVSVKSILYHNGSDSLALNLDTPLTVNGDSNHRLKVIATANTHPNAPFYFNEWGEMAIRSRWLKVDHEDSYSFTVAILDADGLIADTAIVNIDVVEVDTRAPEFLVRDRVETIILEEDTNLGELPIGASAIDPDGDRVTYSLKNVWVSIGGSNGARSQIAEKKFAVNSDTGAVILLEALDYDAPELVQDHTRRGYMISILATDEHGAKASKTVFVQVADPNVLWEDRETTPEKLLFVDQWWRWTPVDENGIATYKYIREEIDNLFVINANTPAAGEEGTNHYASMSYWEEGDEIYLIKSDIPESGIIIKDGNGQNTIRFDIDVDVSHFVINNVDIDDVPTMQMIVTLTTGQSFTVMTPVALNNFQFLFAQDHHPLEDQILTAQQLADYFADKSDPDAPSYVVVTPSKPEKDSEINLGDTDNNPSTPDVDSKVDAGDGSDKITGGKGDDEITGGKGDDNIDLGASDADTDVVIYGIGGRSAKDGGDNISNFNRGVDQFVFSLDSNQAGVSDVTDYDSFLDYITKGTATLDDDEFRVQLQLGEGSDGNAQIEGLLFHFANASFYSGGRLSLPLMKISFADPIGTEGIMDIFTDDAGEPIQVLTALNKYFFITDLDVLDDFMGGADSITYEIA
jgi:hypothetical protein